MRIIQIVLKQEQQLLLVETDLATVQIPAPPVHKTAAHAHPLVATDHVMEPKRAAHV